MANKAVLKANMNWLKASHKGSSTWRAHMVDIKLVENHSTVCQSVNIRSGDLIGTMEPDIVPSLIGITFKV